MTQQGFTHQILNHLSMLIFHTLASMIALFYSITTLPILTISSNPAVLDVVIFLSMTPPSRTFTITATSLFALAGNSSTAVKKSGLNQTKLSHSHLHLLTVLTTSMARQLNLSLLLPLLMRYRSDSFR